MKALLGLRKRALSCLAAALTAVGALLLPAAAPAQASSPCTWDNPPDWCSQEPDDGANDPTGTVSSAVRSPGGITVSGQAHDPNGGPVVVTITVGGTSVGALTANQDGTYSGFVSVPTATGTVCALANNIGEGTDANLGCSTLSVSHDPIVHVDSYQVVGSSSWAVTGWAIDPDTASPVQVEFEYLSTDYNGHGWFGVFGPYTADLSRPDVGAAYPGYGNSHGYSVTFTPAMTYGCHGVDAVSVRALNVGAGTSPTDLVYICS